MLYRDISKLILTAYSNYLLAITVAFVIGMDQLTKHMVSSTMNPYESWPRTGFIRITNSSNTGTAFGLLQDQTAFLILASVFAIGFLYYFYRTQALNNRMLRLAIGLQLGGAVGNLIDRVRLGAVVDFVDVGPWPIFNLADSSIVCGIAILITVILLKRKEPQPLTDSPESANKDTT